MSRVVHYLKAWPEPFDAIWIGDKQFEYRKNDREYRVGDTLVLEEYDPGTGIRSGRSVGAEVMYIARGPEFGIPEGYCAMSIATESKSQ